MLASVKNWTWAVIGKKQVLASAEDQSLWPDKKQVLAFVENWNATVVGNNGACIGIVHRCGQKEAVACNCEKLDTPVVGKKQVLAPVEDQSQWLEKKLVLASMEDPTATVAENKWCLHHGSSGTNRGETKDACIWR